MRRFVAAVIGSEFGQAARDLPPLLDDARAVMTPAVPRAFSTISVAFAEIAHSSMTCSAGVAAAFRLQRWWPTSRIKGLWNPKLHDVDRAHPVLD